MSLHKFMTEWLTRTRIGLILLVLVLIPAFFPLKLPIREDPISRQWAVYHQNMKDGSTLIWGWQEPRGLGLYETWKFDMRVQLRFYAYKHIRVIFAPFFTGLDTAFIDLCKISGLESDFGYVYGVDYVILPFIPGEEIAFAAVANNLKTSVAADSRNIPINQIPLLTNINTLNDIDYAYFYVHMALTAGMIRQWGSAFPDRPNGLMAGVYSEVATYYGTIVKCAKDVMTEAIWQQKYTKDAGEAVSLIDQRNLGSYFFVILFALGVVDYQMQRRQKIQPKEVVR